MILNYVILPLIYWFVFASCSPVRDKGDAKGDDYVAGSNNYGLIPVLPKELSVTENKCT